MTGAISSVNSYQKSESSSQQFSILFQQTKDRLQPIIHSLNSKLMHMALDNLRVIYFNKLMVELVKHLKSQNDNQLDKISQASKDVKSREEEQSVKLTELKS